ncbi:hypothetical protein M1373_01750 [Candidatus Marsarchaeota archaeon]|nr:hypothetical protein [Candidatus Marsarchaeota archaeon]
MSFLRNIIFMLFVLAVIGLIAYYFNLFGAKNILSSISPISSTVPNSQVINGPLGNNINANYSSQYKVAVNITKKYNEPIKHLILFTGNSSSSLIETNNEQQFLSQFVGNYAIKYDGSYTPIVINISDEFINNTTYIPSFIGKKVYIEFKTNSNNIPTIQVPYIVKSEQIGKPKVLWTLTQDTGISNSTAINVNHLNFSEAKQTVSFPIGIYYNGTEILFPSKS